MNIDFLPKVISYNPDIVFILDKPLVDQEFLDKINVPVIWIDHHNPIERKGVKYYNPRLKDRSDGRPTSYWCYKIVEENLWISMLGSIGDYFLPEFSKEFSKKYPKLIKKIDLDEIKFNSELGKLVKICSFMLKGKISEVDNYIDYFCSINDPHEILNKTSKKGKLIYDKFDKINKIYEKYLEEGIKTASKDKLLLYEYSPSQITFNEELANELINKFPKKIVMIAREKKGYMRLSIRSRKIVIPPILEKSLKDLDGSGGGHEHACGANILKEDFQEFIKRFNELIS
ncbi:MAG: DHH family phosphoesterase [Candidatus Nanoarchaeia archaeon]|nr:DHH family phosphoesterase [Candidatus Nanoarchaeia archaeon]